MMVNGLPAHVLLVHAIVVFVPLCAVLVVMVAVWPAARERLSLFTAVLAVLTLAMVPITTEAGDWLEHRLPRTPLLRIHTHLGDSMLPWAVGLAVVAVALFARQRIARHRSTTGSAARHSHPSNRPTRTSRSSRVTIPTVVPLDGRAVNVTMAALAIVVAVGSVYTVYRIGDSGARAAWTGQFNAQPLPRAPHSP